ncbi:MEDS domain-containing protein [Saccharothrix yanglingensis]|uniref:MEDS domain-containing protein n=1 Tax=Saccharothrix yanglingensis TaxID=659496 RepID=A0ABU0X8G5_9PSEU|nr:MEDS domain-containing protein [Saccharothrix yanglingensis]MDQ2588418.1 hypothetical protein [Saccharothrix yanglingensis]
MCAGPGRWGTRGGSEPGDHACRRFRDARGFRDRAPEGPSEGLTPRYRVRCTGTGGLDGLDGTAEADRALRTSAAQVASPDATCPIDTVVEPAAQARNHAGAPPAVGFTGLPVAAHRTPLVRIPERLAAFARYEHRIDRRTADRPFPVMCACAADEVDDDAFTQVGCIDPNADASSPGFRLHAGGNGVAAPGGEVNRFDEDLFTPVPRRADSRSGGGEPVLATDPASPDHLGLLCPARHAADRGVFPGLRTWPGVSTLVDLLDLANIRVERAA